MNISNSNVPSVQEVHLLPWIAAVVFFMQTLDTSILNTALPAIATDLHESPINMQSAVISYALTLALFIPVSGFLADRFGTRNVFVIAIGFFTLGSLFCSLSTSLFWLDVSRVIQGIGGSMMVPVSRLTLIKVFKRHEFLAALNTSLTFGMIGPMVGPVVGGYFVEVLSWHWIFLINIPIGIIGVIFGIKYMPNIFGARSAFDFIGAILIAVCVVSATWAFEFINEGKSVVNSVLLLLLAILALLLYRTYARLVKAPIFPLILFSIRTFRIGILGNLFSRLGISAIPLLIPLLLQVVFGYSALTAGLLLIPMGVASALMRIMALPILRRFGYRLVLIYNTFIVGVIIMSLALLTTHSSYIVIIGQLLLLGFANSLQFTAMNSVALADLEGDITSSGNSLVNVNQQLAISFGTAFGAALLRIFSEMTFLDHNLYYGFQATFVVLGVTTALSLFIFKRLKPTDGQNLIINVKKTTLH